MSKRLYADTKNNVIACHMQRWCSTDEHVLYLWQWWNHQPCIQVSFLNAVFLSCGRGTRLNGKRTRRNIDKRCRRWWLSRGVLL